MKLSHLLMENAPHTLLHAIDNTLHKLRGERTEHNKDENKKAIEGLTDEINSLKELKDRLEYGHAARDFWANMSKKTKDRLPLTQNIRDYLQ